MSVHLDRGRLLFQQGRADLAERELRQGLAEQPDDAFGHAWLSLAINHLKRYDEAIDEAAEAIRLAPDLGLAHFALGDALLGRERPAEARAAAEEAIRLDPWVPDYFTLLAETYYHQSRWREALDAADLGLAIDAEHIGCANLRAMALVKLGRNADAASTIEGALARDPENAYTHSNQGWARLHAADHAGALQYFQEALRLDPTLPSAREGLVEALKARNPIYGLLLRYFLWMSRLSPRVRWGVLLAGVVLGQVAGPFWPLYALVVYLTWAAVPLFNALLRFNRYGRHALTPDEVTASNWVAGLLLGAVGALVAVVVTRHLEFALAALVLAGLVIPVAGAYFCRAGWPRLVMGLGAAAIAVVGLGGVAMIAATMYGAAPLLTARQGATLVRAAMYGIMASTWVGAILAEIRPRRAA